MQIQFFYNPSAKDTVFAESEAQEKERYTIEQTPGILARAKLEKYRRKEDWLLKLAIEEEVWPDPIVNGDANRPRNIREIFYFRKQQLVRANIRFQYPEPGEDIYRFDRGAVLELDDGRAEQVPQSKGTMFTSLEQFRSLLERTGFQVLQTEKHCTLRYWPDGGITPETYTVYYLRNPENGLEAIAKQ